MPRRPSKAADTGKDGGDEPTTASYLDSFLNRITEENDLPGDLKNTLKQLRDLDTQAQEIFERMQKLSKNYIARAKRSVQGGQEPDEEPLHKARKLHKELLELDEQKLAIATESHKSIVQQLQTCEVELTSFAHELREKGQLKDPSKVVVNPAGPSAARPLSAAAEAAVSASAASSLTSCLASLAPTLSPAASVALSHPPAGGEYRGGAAGCGNTGGVPTGRRQSRPSAVLREAAEPPPPPRGTPSVTGHKRGRGRKLSGAEGGGGGHRPPSGTPLGFPPSGYDGLGGAGTAGHGFVAGGGYTAGGRAAGFAPLPPVYPDAVLPLAPKEESHFPLCGAVPQTAGEVLSEKTKVAARMSGGHKGQPEEWILAVVQRYNANTSKYVVLDVDAGDDPFGLSDFGSKQHTIPARFVIALPTSEPSHYSTYNEFKAGSTVLALYPDTTCFYKAYVHTPPSQLPPTPQQRHDYLIEFEDENEVSGRSEAIRVPQKYTLRLPS